MSTPATITWLSASRLAQAAECEKYALHVWAFPEPFDIYPTLGKLRHKVIESCHELKIWPPSVADIEELTVACHEANPLWKKMIDAKHLDKTSKAMAALAVRTHLWPDPSSILSVEGSGLPDLYRARIYDSDGFAVPVETEVDIPWGLRGIFDVIYIRTSERNGRTIQTLVARDWKGSGGDYRWQARIYALAMWMIWPEFDEYQFEGCFITKNCTLKSYYFAMTDELVVPKMDFELIPTAYDKVATLARRMMEIKRTQRGHPTACEKCWQCPLRGTCLAYQVSQAKKNAKKAVSQ